ncbi:MAG: cytochrome c biogenesis protein CcsA [Gammaproteobacteria bacterium]|nr:cytochrome c biogenesis protein CcsA [Gammaproteobacteria bacterium]MDP2140522.1 cytochrome c biogenesis protein CcsA [Gammaproteobacteria bacterium]MDP2348831.1 cytochrome c biogenesis protein CcsA [Gammaproteobacteria bacterium]
MQLTTLAGLIAVVFYTISCVYQGRRLKTRTADNDPGHRVFFFGLLAVMAHAVSAGGVIKNSTGYHFGIVEISTLIGAAISLIVLISSLRKPLGNLMLGLFPLAMLSIFASITVTSSYPAQNIEIGIAGHILLSILAYSILTIAALQASFLAFQNYQLKHKHAASVIKRFPPLQDMETFLFELLWVGQILLTLGIIAGFVFVEDLWAQGLPHKTFFSILAWMVFAVLLWGRHRLGWRGKTAIRGTLTGFLFLILGFYGSKIVLEFIL